MNPVKNIFSEIPDALPEEVIAEILDAGAFKVERIISHAHSSPKGFWYDQETDEWVLVLRGSAGLLFEKEEEIFILGPGDYIHIPAHTRHRVEWTHPAEKTIWLALHY
jgi:cupin 2 domain-containing protein